MEWYLGSEVDNLVIPKVQESLERIKSLVNWTLYDATAFRAGSCFPKKNLFVGTNRGCKQEHYFNGIYTGEMNLNDSVQEREHHNSVHDKDQARIDRMDDIFINSLLEEDVTSDDNPSGNSFNDILLEQQFIPSNSHSLRSSKYLKTHDFSPPMDWENAEVSSSFSAKTDSLSDFIEEESSLEESVLHELEMVTAQFTAKRRICFRDALYRLAENSKQPSHSQDGDINMDDSQILTSDDENSRNGQSEVEELRMNAINRAVEGLMFSWMNFGDGEDNEMLESSNCGVSYDKISYCPLLARLAEVPIVPS